MKHGLLCALVAAFGLSGCATSGIPLLGLDDEGDYYNYFVEDEEFSGHLSTTLDTVNDSFMESVRLTNGEGTWHMRTVAVSLGFVLEAGLGPVIKGGMTPKFGVVFSNSKKPVIP
ncbi:MAG: hypothetical protein H6624_01945 [Bdellovibrionaceae bacterium]|nr:hypothetical protein [Bdellovibrionales bacterium]MCB9083071.1 hypothetical protein [Pseudobdellovibrionaceae bacterium]